MFFIICFFKCGNWILLIRDMGLDVEIVSITTKPYIPQKIYFYEFVANVLHDNIGIIIFDLHGGC